MRTVTDIDYTGNGDPYQLLNLYFPDEEPKALLVFFHGGCLTKGNRQMSDERATSMTEKGIGIISVEYRLVPAVSFPAFLEDAAQAVRYVLEHKNEWGNNLPVFVSGASAGAYITMMLHFNPVYYENAGVDKNAIAGYISESAQQCAHFTLLEQRGLDSRAERIDETAPFFYLDSHTPLRPLSLIYYSHDMACRPEENKLLFANIHRFFPEADVEITEIRGTHCHPEENEDLAKVFYTFINRHLS